MTLLEIKEIATNLPTIPSLVHELQLMSLLMKLAPNELTLDKESLYLIFGKLSVNGGWGQVTLYNEREIIIFNKWLVEIDKDLKLGITEIFDVPICLAGSPTWNKWLEENVSEERQELVEQWTEIVELFLDYYFHS